MQFSIIGQWLIDGKSPNTGQPVLETCRIVKPEHFDWKCGDEKIFFVPPYRRGYYDSPRVVYAVGKTYAIQSGRGQKAIGRTPPLASIRRQDVRTMTLDDAVRRGFASVENNLLFWTQMHDPTANAICWRDESFACLRHRPADRYDAWVLTFEGGAS